MTKHAFLSDDWFQAVERLVEEHRPDGPTVDLVMNLVVTDTPFGAEQRLHVGTQGGRGHWGIGHRPDADVTVTTDYETAREILFSTEPQAGLDAFLAGRVKIQGDLAKLIAAQGVSAGGEATAGGAGGAGGASTLAAAIQGITE
jgi:hypothetical protein